MIKQTDKMLELYNLGYCDSDMGKQLGVSGQTVNYWRSKQKLPVVFLARKRLTFWEEEKILAYTMKQPVCRTTRQKWHRGLVAFVMSLKKPLSQLTHEDVENYVMQHNHIEESRRIEFLRTPAAQYFKIPHLSVKKLYHFSSQIICARIFYRDKGCVVCKTVTKLHLHHMRGKYDLCEENLLTLCERCHLTVRHAALQERPGGDMRPSNQGIA
jgi:hypothetical protein